MSKKLTIKIPNLHLDLLNPRYDVQKSQSEALNTMAVSQGEKLLVLLRDIIAHGLNPSDIPIVMPDPQRKTGYIVLEGNRRVAALKLLLKPEILTNEKLKKKYIKLNVSSKNKISTSMECLVVESREEANLWIERKHEGEMNGAGTVRWDNVQKDRFLANKSGKTSKAVQLIDFLRAAAPEDATLMEQLQRISATNLDRFISTPDIRTELGLEYDKGLYSSRYPVSEILKGLKAVIRLMSAEGFKVGNIYHKEDRIKFLHKIPTNELPDKQDRVETPWSLSEYHASGTNVDQISQPTETDKQSSQQQAQATSQSKEKCEQMLPTTRETLVRSDLTITIPNDRCNRVFSELKKMSHNQLPNTCAVMMRVFLELSVDCYLETNHLLKDNAISAAKDGRDLKQKTNAVIQHLIQISKNPTSNQTKFLDEPKAKGIRSEINNDNSVFSINTMNAYVHNSDFNPIPNNLMLAWDNIQPFIVALWRAINHHSSTEE